MTLSNTVPFHSYPYSIVTCKNQDNQLYTSDVTGYYVKKITYVTWTEKCHNISVHMLRTLPKSVLKTNTVFIVAVSTPKWVINMNEMTFG